MNKNMFSLFLILVVTNLVYSQTSSRFEQLREIYRTICGNNVSKDKLDIAKECEEDLPDLVSSNFAGCVKEVFKVRRVTKPLLCYRGQSGGDQLKSCLERRARALKKKAPKGIDLEKLRNKVLNEYTECLAQTIR